MPFFYDLIVNIATDLVITLFTAGASQLKDATLGDPQERALRSVFDKAFQDMLYKNISDLNSDSAKLVSDILQQFLSVPEVADNILHLALT